MITGGTGSVIVILPSFYEGPQYVLCHNNQNHACHKTVYGIEFRPSFPCKVKMLVQKELDDEQNQKGTIKTAEKNFHVFGIVKKIDLGLLTVDC